MKFRLSGKFGEYAEVRGNAPHTGIDLAMPEGTQLRSLFNGTVEKVFDGGKIGNGVSIKLDDGSANTIYGHMKQVNVHVGERVHSGELIGLSGNTGNSTGPHLHFGMKDSHGHFVDPTEHAEKLASISGSDVDHVMGISSMFNLTTPFGDHIIDKVKEHAGSAVKEHAAEMTKEIASGIFEGLGDILLETIGSITLLGSGILIIMKMAGFDKGYKWAGMLNVANILIKAMIRGVN